LAGAPARGRTAVTWLATAATAALAISPGAPARAERAERADDGTQSEQVFAQRALCVMSDPQNGWRPCVGLARDGLSYHDFYLLAGRPALAEKDEHRWWRRQILIASGVGTTALGTLSLIPFAAGKRWIPLPLSLGAIAGGVVLAVLGTRVPEDPIVDSAEATDLARHYNLHLREQLGLPPPEGVHVVMGIAVARRF
jgi:hypothetical protein